MSRGDTGIIPFRVDGVTLTQDDRAVFTVRRGGGTVLIQKVIEPQGEMFYVPITNEESDGWKPGLYTWDLRIVLDAQVDAVGMVNDGREVITPWPPSRFEVVKVVGKV